MTNWIKKHKDEHYYKKAKSEKFKSRAAYKLLEINSHFKILKNAKVIIDLCCAPGSWIQVLERKLSKIDDFSIIAVDLVDIDIRKDFMKFVKGDITNDDLILKIKEELPRLADLLISDCSPKLIGAREIDHVRQIFLAECALKIAKECLRVGGVFITKVFQGDMLEQYKKEVLKNFHSCRVYKPRASSKKSREHYLLAFGLKPKNFRK
ncbi:MAG: SAM-dependent methyltransferase [Candidatus Helarchaeota archaeon]